MRFLTEFQVAGPASNGMPSKRERAFRRLAEVCGLTCGQQPHAACQAAEMNRSAISRAPEGMPGLAC